VIELLDQAPAPMLAALNAEAAVAGQALSGTRTAAPGPDADAVRTAIRRAQLFLFLWLEVPRLREQLGDLPDVFTRLT